MTAIWSGSLLYALMMTGGATAPAQPPSTVPVVAVQPAPAPAR